MRRNRFRRAPNLFILARRAHRRRQPLDARQIALEGVDVALISHERDEHGDREVAAQSRHATLLDVSSRRQHRGRDFVHDALAISTERRDDVSRHRAVRRFARARGVRRGRRRRRRERVERSRERRVRGRRGARRARSEERERTRDARDRERVDGARHDACAVERARCGCRSAANAPRAARGRKPRGRRPSTIYELMVVYKCAVRVNPKLSSSA